MGKMINRIVIGITVILFLLLPGNIIYGANSLGEIIAQGTIQVTLSDGSVITLTDEKYPLFPGSVINTLTEGRATLNVKDGRYVIGPNSIFHVEDVRYGRAGLIAREGEKGEVCYCFNPYVYFIVDTPLADTIPHEGEEVTRAEYRSVEGRSKVINTTTYTLQLEGIADFVTPGIKKTLGPGEATSNPPVDNPYDPFKDRTGCCEPSGAPFLLLGGAGAAVIGGAVGAALGSGGGDGSPFTPPP